MTRERTFIVKLIQLRGDGDQKTTTPGTVNVYWGYYFKNIGSYLVYDN